METAGTTMTVGERATLATSFHLTVKREGNPSPFLVRTSQQMLPEEINLRKNRQRLKGPMVKEEVNRQRERETVTTMAGATVGKTMTTLRSLNPQPHSLVVKANNRLRKISIHLIGLKLE